MPEPSVAAFNALDDATALDLLLDCMHAPGWARSMLAGRPYPDRAALLARAYRYGVLLDDEELADALSRHLPADAADPELAQRLRDGNLAYEAKFGRVFVIRTAGLRAEQVVAALTLRLQHDPATEAGVVRDQLAQIAQLRLDRVLSDLA